MIPIPAQALFPWESVPVMVPAPVLESAPPLELALEFQSYSLLLVANFCPISIVIIFLCKGTNLQ